MNEAESIINELNLEPHPEGGHFTQCFKNKDISVIYYLLKKNEESHWHRLTKSETLHFYKGDPLTIYISENGKNFDSIKIKEKYDYILTAHNRDDLLETLYMQNNIDDFSILPYSNFNNYILTIV